MFKIDKHMPIPEQIGSGARAKYPFAKMEVGDSFFVPSMRSNALSNAAQWHTKKTGKKFTCANVEGGVRCWRIE